MSSASPICKDWHSSLLCQWRLLQSVTGVIIVLLNGRWFVTTLMFPWCTGPCIGKNKLVIPLFAFPTRQGTLSLCCFLLLVQLAKEVYTKCCYFIVWQAVFPDFLELLGVCTSFRIVCTKCSGQRSSHLVLFNEALHKASVFHWPTNANFDFS